MPAALSRSWVCDLHSWSWRIVWFLFSRLRDVIKKKCEQTLLSPASLFLQSHKCQIMVLISLLKLQDLLKIWLHPKTAYWKMPLKLQPCQVTFCRQRSWGISNCLFARTAWCISVTDPLGNADRDMCPALSWLHWLQWGRWSTQWLGQHLRGAEPRAGLDPGCFHLENDTWWAGSFDQLQRFMKHRNTPACAVATVEFLGLRAAVDQPEQVLCVSGMLVWSKTCFKKHSWQCKKRNSF